MISRRFGTALWWAFVFFSRDTVVCTSFSAFLTIAVMASIDETRSTPIEDAYAFDCLDEEFSSNIEIVDWVSSEKSSPSLSLQFAITYPAAIRFERVKLFQEIVIVILKNSAFSRL